MKNSNKVSQVVKIVINQKRKKRTRRKVKKAKALSTLADVLNFQRIQNGFNPSNAGATGLNAGDVLNIINSKVPKTYTTGMIDGKPIKIEVGMTGKELEKKLLDAYADKDDDGKVSQKEINELKDYARNLEQAYADLSTVESTPFKTPPKETPLKFQEAEVRVWLNKLPKSELRKVYEQVSGNKPPPNILEETMKFRLLDRWRNELGNYYFDEPQTGGGLPLPPPPLSPITEGGTADEYNNDNPLGDTEGGGVM